MPGFSPLHSHREHPTVEIVRPGNPSVLNSDQPITQTNYSMANGEQGTYQALRLMAACVRGECPPDFSGFKDEFNCRGAVNIVVQGQKPFSSEKIIAALFQFVRDNIRYIDHPAYQQVVQDCRRTLELGSGDCVSKSVCLATLLACHGIETKFVAQHPTKQSGFSHVYLECQDLVLDPIADGKHNRPFFNVGQRQSLPDGGFEMSWSIFS